MPRRHAPPPTKFPSTALQPSKAAPRFPGTQPPPPPTRYGSAPLQPAVGRAQAGRAQAAAVAQPACLLDCFRGLYNKLFSSGGGDTGSRQPLLDLEEQRTPPVRTVVSSTFTDGATDQDTVARDAHPLAQRGRYDLGLVTGCTAVYIQGAAYGTVGHMFMTNYRDYIMATMLGYLRSHGDDEVLSAKVYFSAEGDQKDWSTPTSSQRQFANAMRSDLRSKGQRGVTFNFYVYDPRKNPLLLNSGGDPEVYGDRHTRISDPFG
ncbi:hypothetical protein [Azospirillum sp. ST 5-10]|uniref:hypothetical protein n=1 Tax=unclassified Azospirillum TaxID=2630922 RepID=UPI003F49D0F5